MLDIALIREQPDKIKVGLEKKGFDPALVDEVSLVDEKRRRIQQKVESLRAERNQIGQTDLNRAKVIKEELVKFDSQLHQAEDEYTALMLKLPNMPAEDVPVGPGETANTVLKTVGTKPTIKQPLDHLTLGLRHNLLDTERASKVSGSRFNYLKNQAVLIELALVRLTIDIAVKYGYQPIIPPVLVNERTVLGTGYLPHGEDEVYKTQDDLYLVGTSELSTVAYHQDELLATNSLPLRYVAFSTCFRREAGSYGKDTKGIIRQHQFDKVEMVSFVAPDQSVAELDRILMIEEEFMRLLGLHYRVLTIGTGDLGIQAVKKYDIETWFPSQDTYRETHSASNTTDFQARRLNIRYKNEDDNQRHFVHTLNGTAVAIPRFLAALIENGQQPDGTIRLPDALIPYLGWHQIG